MIFILREMDEDFKQVWSFLTYKKPLTHLTALYFYQKWYVLVLRGQFLDNLNHFPQTEVFFLLQDVFSNAGITVVFGKDLS